MLKKLVVDDFPTPRKTILRHKVDFNEFFAPEMRIAYAAGVRCGCGEPLISHDQVFGSINIGSLRENAFTVADAEMLEQIAGPVALAVETDGPGGWDQPGLRHHRRRA